MSQESRDFKMFQDLWALLDGEKLGGVSVDNLLYLLLLIRGTKLPAREKDYELDQNRDYQNQPVLKLAMVDEEGKLIVAQGGQKKIFAHFKDLYINRMQFEGKKAPK